MRPAFLVVALLGVLLSGVAPRLDASVITFDGATGDLFDQLDEDGFRVVSGSGFFVGNSTFCSPDCPDNGTRYAMTQDGWVPMRFSSLSGEPFSFHRLDLGEQHLVFPGPDAVLIRGYRTDGTTTEQLAVLDQVNDGTGPLTDFQTIEALPGFESLYLLEVVVPPPPLVGRHRYSLDNVVLESRGVQEIPAISRLGAALFAAVLLGVAWLRLRGAHGAA